MPSQVCFGFCQDEYLPLFLLLCKWSPIHIYLLYGSIIPRSFNDPCYKIIIITRYYSGLQVSLECSIPPKLLCHEHFWFMQLSYSWWNGSQWSTVMCQTKVGYCDLCLQAFLNTYSNKHTMCMCMTFVCRRIERVYNVTSSNLADLELKKKKHFLRDSMIVFYRHDISLCQ